WNQPWVVWQVISHKFLRPVVPIAMIGALLANLAAVLWPSPVSGLWGWFLLAPPVNWILLAGQLLFYGAAWLGGRIGKRRLMGKLLYLPTFLVNSNMAALVGLF